MTQQATEQQQPPSSPSIDEIPDGFYDAQAVGEGEPHVLYGESSNNNDEVGIEMKLLDLNRNVFVVLSFSDAATPYSLQRLRALGWKGGDDMAGITANKVSVRAKTERFVDREGKERSKQKFEIMTGDGRFTFQKPMDEQRKRGFFARLNAVASQAPAAKNGQGGAQGGGYPANWDENSPPAGKPPRVDLG